MDASSIKPSYQELYEENELLKAKLAKLEQSPTDNAENSPTDSRFNTTMNPYSMYHNLSPQSVERYSRHLILKNIGVQAQEKWLRSSVLVIGAGGLGSPVLLYLVASGVGHITLIDHDRVDQSNLHRQVIHSEDMVGQFKVDSAIQACRRLNSYVKITPMYEPFTTENCLELCARHDIVVDCTDNPATRYLASDACVYTNTPLVSAAVVGLNGQLTNYCLDNGPCYRCVNPTPPPSHMVQNCSDSGVFGPLVGVIGTMQALEALKVLAKVKQLPVPPPASFLSPCPTNSPRASPMASPDEEDAHALSHDSWPPLEPTQFAPLNEQMIFWDAVTSSIRTARIRGRQASCMCSRVRPASNAIPSPFLDVLDTIDIDTIDWSCGSTAPSTKKAKDDQATRHAQLDGDNVAPVKPIVQYLRIHPSVLPDVFPLPAAVIKDRDNSIDGTYDVATDTNMIAPPHPPLEVVDVRVPEQFQICSLPRSHHCPYNIIHTRHWVLRDLLWAIYAKRFPECVEPYTMSLEQQQQADALEQESDPRKLARLRREMIPPRHYQLREEQIQLLFTETLSVTTTGVSPASLDPPTVTINSTDTLSAYISPTTPDTSSIPHIQTLPIAFICRRGVLSMYILKYITSLLQDHILSSDQTATATTPTPPAIDNNDTILTHPLVRSFTKSLVDGSNGRITYSSLSTEFAKIAVCAGYPPFTASDIVGGITKISEGKDYFPIY